MAKKNVAILIDYVLSDMMAGDMVSTFHFADLLKKRGNKIIFLAAKVPKKPNLRYFRGIRTYCFRSIPIIKKENTYFAFPTVKQLMDTLKKEKIEILHITCPTPAAILAMYAAKKLGIKIIAHSHSQPENITMKFFKKNIDSMNPVIYKYLVSLYKNADRVICPSKFAEAALKEYDRGLKTKAISNGIFLEKFKFSNPRSFLKKHRIPEKSRKILYVGRLHSEKNPEILVKAMPRVIKEIGDAHLMIIGQGKLKDRMNDLAKELGVGDRVSLLGKVDDKELLQAYSACDLFVLPSWVELEGMVVLEAMSLGKPIMISNSKDSAARFFVKGNGFLFNPRNPRDLADKAIKILKDASLRKRMGKRSLKIIKNYSIHKSVDKIEEAYNS